MIRKLKTLSVIDAMLVTSTVFAGLGLATNFSVAATTTSVPATVRISSACSLGKTIDTPHEVTLSNGNYSGASGYGQTTLKAFCNDSGGFAIYAIGYTSDKYGNTTMHWNKAASSSDNTNAIPTEVYDAGNMSNSSWSMKLSALSGTYPATIDDGVAANNNSTEDFTSWHEIPETYTRVAYRLSGTDTEQNGSGVGSSITVTYDTYITPTQPAGSYTGQVKFTLVHPSTAATPEIPLEPLATSDCPAYSICYAPNHADIIGSMSVLGSITNSPNAGQQTQTLNGNSYDTIGESTTRVTLVAPNYSRPGFGFAGWTPDFTIDSESIIYGPNADIVIDPTNDGIDLSINGLILYPVWIESEGVMQEWNDCSSLEAAEYDSTNGEITATLDSLTALTDSRDDNTYTVARLADGLCWMVENLRLNAEHSISAEDINKAQGYSTYSGTGTNYGNFIGLADSERSNFSEQSSAVFNSLYSSDGRNNTINIGTSDYASYRIPRYNKDNTDINNSELPIVYRQASGGFSRWFGYGNNYNWDAAAATTGYNATNTSICPKGWKLPIGGYSSDANALVGGYSYLDRTMGGTGQNQASNAGKNQSRKWRSFPNNFVFAGRINGNSYYNRGNSGGYWSETTRGGGSFTYAYELNFMLGTVNPNTYTNRYEGHSVRCVIDI